MHENHIPSLASIINHHIIMTSNLELLALAGASIQPSQLAPALHKLQLVGAPVDTNLTGERCVWFFSVIDFRN